MVAKKKQKATTKENLATRSNLEHVCCTWLYCSKGWLKRGRWFEGGGGFLPWPARAGFSKGVQNGKKKHTHTNIRTTNTADCAHVNPPVRRLYPFRFLARPALCESIKVSGRIKNELSCERYFVTATGGSTRN